MTMRTVFSSSVFGGLILLLAVTSVLAADSSTPTVPKPKSSPKAEVITATGEGAMPTAEEQPNRAKAYLQAKAYAQAQAVANLIQAARGTSISYSSTGKDFAMDQRITQEISGMVDSVQVTSERRVQIGKDTVCRGDCPGPAARALAEQPGG